VPQATNRQWRLARRPSGPVQESDFVLAEGPEPTAGAGQVVVRNQWLSFDPHTGVDLRSTRGPGAIPVGGVIPGIAVGEVVESQLPGFSVGDRVEGTFGWEEYTVTDGRGFFPMIRVPATVSGPLALGALGMTGLAAYFGVMEVGVVRRGETFLVSGAAGAVGSVAGQLARLQGLRVVGVAGGREKCEWLERVARLDGAIDGRSEDLSARVAELLPDGVDVAFDNVGGPFLETALRHLRRNGRIVLCGAISRYEATPAPAGPVNYPNLILRHGRMEGFLVSDYVDRFPEALRSLTTWVSSGEIRTKEDVVEGFDNAPRAFARLFRRENFGKQLLRIDPHAP